MAGLRQRFADNLRRLSSGAESYAAVARAVGINRQQFNDYLTAKNLPNETIIKKLCKHFGVDLSAFFLEIQNSSPKHEVPALDDNSSAFVSKFIDAHMGKQTFLPKPGLYHIYFLAPQDDNIIICSLLSINNTEKICKFKRITKLTSEDYYEKSRNYSVHNGFVIYSSQQVFLIGGNVLDNMAPSFMMCGPVISKDVLYYGKAFLNAPTQYDLVHFVIPKPQRKMSPREAFQDVKLHNANTPRLSQSAVKYLLDAKRGVQPS